MHQPAPGKPVTDLAFPELGTHVDTRGCKCQRHFFDPGSLFDQLQPAIGDRLLTPIAAMRFVYLGLLPVRISSLKERMGSMLPGGSESLGVCHSGEHGRGIPGTGRGVKAKCTLA
jgi:hypothetical protein